MVYCLQIMYDIETIGNRCKGALDTTFERMSIWSVGSELAS